jgi:hypothetical protein
VLLPRDGDGDDRPPGPLVQCRHGLFAGGEALGEPGGRVLLCSAPDRGGEEAVGARSWVLVCFVCGKGGSRSEEETLSRLPMSRCSRFPPSSSKTLTSGHNFLRFQVEHHGLGALGAHVEADGEAGHCAEGGAREKLRESTLFFSAFFFDVKRRRKKRARALKKKPFLSLSLSLSLLAREPAIDFILKVAPNFPFFPSFILRLTAPLCRCAACLSCARAFASEQLAHESKE